MKGLITRLENVADLSVLQTDSGIDVAGIINGGGCLYVIGSMDDEAVIRVQKMLFARCAQIIIARDEFREWPHVSVMLDEIKYLLSKYVLNALGTLRSRDCNLLLAHQSLGDFGQCGQDLPAEFVKTTVLDNTPIRWFYRAASTGVRAVGGGADRGNQGGRGAPPCQPGGGERGAYQRGQLHPEGGAAAV